jgi:hypothetical protein
MIGTPKVAKPEPDKIYVALTSFTTRGLPEFPLGLTVAQGMRLRGDHPAVRRMPGHFAVDGLDDVAMMRLRQERFPALPPG